MSFLFGKKKEKKTEETLETRQQSLSDTIEKLNKRIEYTNQLIDQERLKAKQFLKARQQNKAKDCVMRIKRFEKQNALSQGQRDNLQEQLDNLQQVSMGSAVFEQIQKNYEFTKQHFGNMDPDTVQDKMDDMMDYQAGIMEANEALARPMGQPIDDDEVNDLLDEIANEDVEAAPAAATTTTAQPAVAQDNDAELNAMLASFA